MSTHKWEKEAEQEWLDEMADEYDCIEISNQLDEACKHLNILAESEIGYKPANDAIKFLESIGRLTFNP